MKAFIDTSSLVKKYKQETETESFIELLEEFEEIFISPMTYGEIDIDFGYFGKISLSNELERVACSLRKKYQLKSLDLIQISSAVISQQKVFVTSDHSLYKIAIKEFKNVELV